MLSYSNNKHFIYLADVKAAGVAGGDFTAGADQIRVLNTKVRDTGNLCTLSSNQFTLQPGRYILKASAPAYRVDRHQAFLYSVTDTADVIIGSSEVTVAGSQFVTTASTLSDILIITTAKTYEIRHRCNTTQTVSGFGLESNLGRNNIYTQVWIETF